VSAGELDCPLESWHRARGMKMVQFSRLARFVCLVVACGWLLVACHSPVKQVSSDVGKGSRQGSPPLCFDYRGEAQATDKAGVSNIWAYLNNTCSYTVNCRIYDDATEQGHPIGVQAYRQLRFLLAASVPANRVKLKLDCDWTP
jgi:hypothetical protein